MRWAVLFLLVGGCVGEQQVAQVQAVCGDGVCEPGEGTLVCPEDCPYAVCGNGMCEYDEDAQNCSGDCAGQVCGDGRCEGNETPYSCLYDCAWASCGNGVCEAMESEGQCLRDCVPMRCGNGVCEYEEDMENCPGDCPSTQSVDVLLVVDDSESMETYQKALAQALPNMYRALQGTVGVEPNLHLGVVTTDLGMGSYTVVSGCRRVGGDGGRLGVVGGADHASGCLAAGAHYMIDTAPVGCSVLYHSDRSCGANDCDQDNCSGEPGTVLVPDSVSGCPRCRNFTGGASEAFACLSQVGIDGCGFEQPLEAARKALDDNPYNQGFLRDDSILVLLFVTDEDDCSAAQPDVLFNPDPSLDSADSTLGFLTSFRCFEFGVTCDQDARAVGPHQGCVSAQPDLLFGIERYDSFLRSLRQPGRIVAAALTGPFADGEVDVELDGQQRPAVAPTCRPDQSQLGAAPAVRIRALVAEFSAPHDLSSWAMTSVCDQDRYASFMEKIGAEVIGKMEVW
ncbi:MAG: hypothetical protein J7M25_17590 [Deltaproteobacteria bacterium]|nr:hypothetical protein [Deltaproteobacteria bacterium]